MALISREFNFLQFFKNKMTDRLVVDYVWNKIKSLSFSLVSEMRKKQQNENRDWRLVTSRRIS